MRTLVLLAVVAVMGGGLAGCAGHPDARTPPNHAVTSSAVARQSEAPSSPPQQPSALPAPFDRCGAPKTHAATVRYQSTGGVSLDGVEIGQGPSGVLLVHESGSQALCGWWPYAAYLAVHGFHVLLFDLDCFGLSSCAPDGKPHYLDDVAASVKQLKAAGVHSVSLVGASLGGSIAFVAGAKFAGSLRSVVDISGDELTTDVGGGAHPMTAYSAAGDMRLPVLFATAPGDRYLTLAAARGLNGRTASINKQLLLQPAGAGHGWDMLAAADGGWTPLATKVAAFLRAHAG